ncbi:MAG: hypothetical protein JKY51_10720 [Opitutaceae bacterium]|nr:hypothetical protein [Opitutaceae bacterium]
MESKNNQPTGGDWKPLFEQGLLIGEDNINIANFRNLDIPEEQRKANLLLASVSKPMLERINQVSRILIAYSKQKEPIPSFNLSQLQSHVIEQYDYMLTLLQSVLPDELKEDLYKPKKQFDVILTRVKQSYSIMSAEEKMMFRSEIIDILKGY